VLEGQRQEVQPLLFFCHAPVVNRVTVLDEVRQLDPCEVRRVAHGPDHRVHLEDPAVFEPRFAVRYSIGSGHPLDAGVKDVFGVRLACAPVFGEQACAIAGLDGRHQENLLLGE
jgi:hypothetical protein